jgi:hypothetical protein
MSKWTITVTVECATAEEAQIVVAERLGFDRGYGYAYTLEFEHDGQSHTPTIRGTLQMSPAALLEESRSTR